MSGRFVPLIYRFNSVSSPCGRVGVWLLQTRSFAGLRSRNSDQTAWSDRNDRQKRSAFGKPRKSNYESESEDGWRESPGKTESRMSSWTDKKQTRDDKRSQGELGSGLKTIDWAKEDLVAFKKNFHTEHPEVTTMANETCRKFLMASNISIKGAAPIPKPLMKFEHAQLPDYILRILKSEGFTSPTAIQSIGWPIAMSGRDSVCVANTGSGKTLGFILPALLHVAAQPPLRTGDGPIALVLAPTRELVMQIAKEASTYGRPGGVLNAAVFGGVSRNGQVNALRQGVEICVATPGRLLDLLESNVTNLRRVTYLVLDESDKMLSMGFEQQIRKIVSQIRPDRQTLLWSATWPKEIQAMARDFCKEDPVMIRVGTSTELQANPDVDQKVTVVDCESDKRGAFKQWLTSIMTPEESNGKKMIIFCDTKRGADNLCRELTYNGYSALSIHGDKEQRERDQILRDFKNGEAEILVATDVAQRGLDIKAVDWVVNFDCPKTAEDYIHRIGRTGRAGAKGNAMTFSVRETDGSMMKEIGRIIKDCGQQIPEDLVGDRKNDIRSFMNKRN
jgi:ATP-dependent RNA helicase DDX5/DBP2